MADAKSVFKGHHEEIRRRVASKDQYGGELPSSSTFSRVKTDRLDDPFESPDQKFVLFSLSHREFAPCPEDPSTPALCVYGTFEAYNEALEHARLVKSQHPEFSLLIDRTHKWIAAVATVARLAGADYVNGKTRAMLDEVEKQRERDDGEFRANVEARRAGEGSAAEDGATDEHDGDATEDGPANARRVHRSCAVPEQRVCVASFVCDPKDPEREFLFRVYAAYDGEERAEQYSMNVCADRVRDHNIDVIRTCTWAFPHRMLGKNVPKERYRHPELDAVMNAHKKAPQEVERFYREWDVVQKSEADAAAQDEGGTQSDAPAAIQEETAA